MEKNRDFPEIDDLIEPTGAVTPEEILGADLHRELSEKFDASPEGEARKAHNEADDAAKFEEAQTSPSSK